VDDLISILAAFAFLAIVIVVFVVLSRRIRRGGGSLPTIMLGATNDLMDKDKRRAAEEIVEMKADKKRNRGAEGDPESPAASRLPQDGGGNENT
jgi:hypothetical protein